MENPRGRVIAVERIDVSPRAVVEVDASVACARCAAGKGCGAGLLGATGRRRRVDALIGDGVTVSRGDEVRMELAPSNILKASLIVYGLPLSGAVAGAALAYIASWGDFYAAVGALIGIVAGIVLARARLQRASCLQQFTPTIVERLSSDPLPIGR
ncbi:MAG: SoxR reducing system RseC family protein [Gammaproteobacteria bacterium]|nr:SoxR reducing system RseC family protein [Gammaproteobacteria bacterium]MBU2677011.1 SoxR reducing system RseC family protein [Gammaproteobacteria bacterium]NNC56444.1 SoxR reducing system RseC family protein [Woeseiaceae bacterium]NNL50743.1 SoxR reducing system RseC family protein [Woeseiaceae bacterium]